MTDLLYTCTACERSFTGVGAFAAHIDEGHTPKARESTLDRYRRRALNLPDDEDDEDDDENEDELLPTRLGDVARRIAELEAHLVVAIAERNNAALEKLRAELDHLAGHWRIAAECLERQSKRAEQNRSLAEWVLREGCEVTR